MEEKIVCNICGAKVHSIQHHLKQDHPEVSVEKYVADFPEAPLMSDAMKAALEKKRAEAAGTVKTEMATGAAAPASVSKLVPKGGTVKKALHEIFGLGKVKAAMSAKGEAIPISVLAPHDWAEYVPEVSDAYVYDIDELKNAILALELNIPTYIWGHKGSGKSELVEQICARTNRPYFRVQHTGTTEESEIVGQWTVKGGETVFELGPLPLAMKHGWIYCADEYDFGLPSATACYQAVMEGKALVIKQADPANRVIKPHPNFRFMATGNTNGSGDETGLYQGTNIQNAANYDRFGMVINKKYLKKEDESQILQNRVGLVKEDADKMAEFARNVREGYDGAKISDTVSPRALINAARIGLMRASFRAGIQLAFTNKLSKVDREVVEGIAQRIFG